MPYGKVATPQDIGRAVRAKRKEKGVRREIAAGMCSVGTKFLSQQENGKETAELGKTQRYSKNGARGLHFPSFR